jgi:hypothetical protein
MNALYHIAVIDGFLSHLPALPKNVQDAVAFLREANAPPAQTKPKKRRFSKKWHEKNLVQLARMRELAREKREREKLQRLKAA